ncbi:MAG TPA: ABC transporter permease [Stellaceae bacterium]|nr:ABC transporter permease [Stellaceae bacterium]
MATDVAAAPMSRFKGLAKPSQEQIVLIVTVLLALTFSLVLPGFATIANFLTLARSVSILGILALGMGLVVIGRGLDLCQVATMAATSAIVIELMQHGWPTLPALAIGLVLALLIGALNGAIIAFMEVPALFTTLATAFFVYGSTRFVLQQMIVYPPAAATGFLYFGQGRPLGIPMPIIVFAAAALFMHWFMSRTTPGKFVYTHGDNPEAARLTGVPLRPLTIMEYGLSALVAFIAGILTSASTASMNMQVVNSTQVFDVILVVVLGGISLIGGRGGVLSVVAGTALIGTLLNGLTIMDLNNEVQDIIKGLVLLAAIVLDNRLHPRDEETSRQGD